MIRKLLLISILFSIEVSSAQNYFSKYYNQNNARLGIVPGPEENYMNLIELSSTKIIKTDSLYNIIWSKEFNPAAGLAGVGPDNSIYLMNTDTAIVRVDSSGVVLWSRKVADPVLSQTIFGVALSRNSISGVFPIDDKVLVVVSQDETIGVYPLSYPSIIAFDTSGNHLWTISDSSSAFTISGIYKSKTGGYWIIGSAETVSLTGKFGVIAKISSSGNCLFSKAVCSPLTNSYFLLMSELADSTYMLAQCSFSYITTSVYYIHVSRINENGDTLWNYVYTLDTALLIGDGENPITAAHDENGNVYILGNNSDAEPYYFILKIDSTGDVKYFKSWTYSTQDFDIAYSQLFFQDHALYWKVYNYPLDITTIIKMDSAGFNLCLPLDTSFQINKLQYFCFSGGGVGFVQTTYLPITTMTSSTNVSTGVFSDFCAMLASINLETSTQIKISPNPFFSTINLQVSGEENTTATLEILNMIGEKIIEKKIVNQDQSLDLSFLSDGCYMMLLKTEKNVISKKIMKYH